MLPGSGVMLGVFGCPVSIGQDANTCSMQHCSTGRGSCQLYSTCHAQSGQAAWPRPLLSGCKAPPHPVNTTRNVSMVTASSGGGFSAFPRGGIFSPDEHPRLCWILCWILLTKRAAIMLSWWWWWWCSLVIAATLVTVRTTVTITLSPPPPPPARGALNMIITFQA